MSLMPSISSTLVRDLAKGPPVGCANGPAFAPADAAKAYCNWNIICWVCWAWHGMKLLQALEPKQCQNSNLSSTGFGPDVIVCNIAYVLEQTWEVILQSNNDGRVFSDAGEKR